MGNLTTVEVKAFVPSKDFDLSKRFYSDLGFIVAWSSDDLACLHAGTSSFLLQRFYRKDHADNFMMHLLVEDVEAWWRHVAAQRLAEIYAVRVNPPEDRPWGMRDFTIDDPTGSLAHRADHPVPAAGLTGRRIAGVRRLDRAPLTCGPSTTSASGPG